MATAKAISTALSPKACVSTNSNLYQNAHLKLTPFAQGIPHTGTTAATSSRVNARFVKIPNASVTVAQSQPVVMSVKMVMKPMSTVEAAVLHAQRAMLVYETVIAKACDAAVERALRPVVPTASPMVPRPTPTVVD